MPFRVIVAPANDSTPSTLIEVLGTRFNVAAYGDGATKMKTTLLEGSVKISNGPESTILKPGQALIENNEALFVRQNRADVEKETAWKNGYFLFDNDSIQTIMEQLCRWYNLQVRYKGVVNNHFSATAPRSSGIANLLRHLEASGLVHFDITGNTITVTPL